GELYGISGKLNVSQMISQDTLIDFYQIVLWIYMAILQKDRPTAVSQGVKRWLRLGIVQTEMELELELSQQDSSHEVSVSTEGVEELKRIVQYSYCKTVLTEPEDQLMALQPHSSGVKIQDPMLKRQR
nr:hypothetical protein [Tanacetum cinerariifolium]